MLSVPSEIFTRLKAVYLWSPNPSPTPPRQRERGGGEREGGERGRERDGEGERQREGGGSDEIVHINFFQTNHKNTFLTSKSHKLNICLPGKPQDFDIVSK